MTILFAGTSPAEFTPAPTLSTSDVATGVGEGFRPSTATDAFTRPPALSSPIGEGWFQYHRLGSFGSSIPFWVLSNGNSQCLRMTANLVIQSFNGSSWSNLGSSFATTPNGFVDVSFKLHATDGYVRVYVAKALVYEFTGNTIFNSVSSIDQVRFFWGGNSLAVYSAVIIADEDTRPLRYAQTALSAQGALAEWTGAVGNVSGTGFNDGTLVTTDTPDQRTTYTKAALNTTFNTGWTIETAIVSVRTSTEPEKTAALRGIARSNSVNGFSSQQNLSNTIDVRQFQIPVDPNTSAAWTVSNFNSAEFGVQSRTPT